MTGCAQCSNPIAPFTYNGKQLCPLHFQQRVDELVSQEGGLESLMSESDQLQEILRDLEAIGVDIKAFSPATLYQCSDLLAGLDRLSKERLP